MNNKTLGKAIFWIGSVLFAIGFVVFIGATPRFMPSRPIGESWFIALPFVVVGIICCIVGFNMFKRKRR